MVGMVMNELRKKIRGEAAHQLLEHVENAAQMAVLEIEQTIAPQIKAALADDGKISVEEARRNTSQPTRLVHGIRWRHEPQASTTEGPPCRVPAVQAAQIQWSQGIQVSRKPPGPAGPSAHPGRIPREQLMATRVATGWWGTVVMVWPKRRLSNWKRLLAINIVGAALVACHPVPPPVVIDPVGPPGDCAGACANLERLQCPGWDGSPGPDDAMGTADDVPCTPTCEEIGAIDPSFLAYQGCIADASDCDSADRCMENAR